MEGVVFLNSYETSFMSYPNCSLVQKNLHVNKTLKNEKA